MRPIAARDDLDPTMAERGGISASQRQWDYKMDPQELLSELRALEVAVHQACIRGDSIRLRELLHPRFREFGRSGRAYSRDDVIALFADQPPAYEILSQDCQLEQLVAGLMLLTYRSVRVNADGTIERHTLRASLWELTDVGWQLRFHQGTPTEAFDVRTDS